MKRIAALLLTVLLTAALAAACTAETENKPAEQPAASEAPAAPSETEATEAPAAAESPAEPEEPESRIDLPDGVYTAEFKTDSTMFRVNEANHGLGVLTVKDGKATIHISLVSKSIVNLYPGKAEDAKKDGAVLLEPTIDVVTYEDGDSEEEYGFDIPVPVIGEEFDVANIGTKGKWYDHKVIVQNPVPQN